MQKSFAAEVLSNPLDVFWSDVDSDGGTLGEVACGFTSGTPLYVQHESAITVDEELGTEERKRRFEACVAEAFADSAKQFLTRESHPADVLSNHSNVLHEPHIHISEVNRKAMMLSYQDRRQDVFGSSTCGQVHMAPFVWQAVERTTQVLTDAYAMEEMNRAGQKLCPARGRGEGQNSKHASISHPKSELDRAMCEEVALERVLSS